MTHPEPLTIEELRMAAKKECNRLKEGWLAAEKNAVACKPHAAELETLQHAFVELERKLTESNQCLHRVYKSRSWRWTSFFRKTEWYLRTYFSSKRG